MNNGRFGDYYEDSSGPLAGYGDYYEDTDETTALRGLGAAGGVDDYQVKLTPPSWFASVKWAMSLTPTIGGLRSMWRGGRNLFDFVNVPGASTSPVIRDFYLKRYLQETVIWMQGQAGFESSAVTEGNFEEAAGRAYGQALLYRTFAGASQVSDISAFALVSAWMPGAAAASVAAGARAEQHYRRATAAPAPQASNVWDTLLVSVVQSNGKWLDGTRDTFKSLVGALDGSFPHPDDPATAIDIVVSLTNTLKSLFSSGGSMQTAASAIEQVVKYLTWYDTTIPGESPGCAVDCAAFDPAVVRQGLTSYARYAYGIVHPAMTMSQFTKPPVVSRAPPGGVPGVKKAPVNPGLLTMASGGQNRAGAAKPGTKLLMGGALRLPQVNQDVLPPPEQTPADARSPYLIPALVGGSVLLAAGAYWYSKQQKED